MQARQLAELQAANEERAQRLRACQAQQEALKVRVDEREREGVC